jgi:hypothetical protein
MPTWWWSTITCSCRYGGQESGFAELIPEAEVMIFDEAHQLPDIASQYFGQSLSSRQLLDLAKDITIAYRTELKTPSSCKNAPTAWRKARRISACSWGARLSRQPARTAGGQPHSARCCCSMMRWNCATTSPNSRWGVRRCSMPPLSAPRSIGRAEAAERDQPAGLQLLV